MPKPRSTTAAIQKALWLADNLNPGEVYAGLILGTDGAPDYHLILLPGEIKDASWDKSKDWAESGDGRGSLPTRREQRLLFVNAKAEFAPVWYWSSEQHASDSDSAWLQGFTSGNQYDDDREYGGRARAVRRLSI